MPLGSSDGQSGDLRHGRAVQVVEQASSRAHKPIAVLAPATAQRWTDADGPSEHRVRSLVGPGNAYLEPVYYFFAGQHGAGGDGAPRAGSRCYFFPAQRGHEFAADQVSGIARLCYVGAAQAPYATGWTAVQ